MSIPYLMKGHEEVSGWVLLVGVSWGILFALFASANVFRCLFLHSRPIIVGLYYAAHEGTVTCVGATVTLVYLFE